MTTPMMQQYQAIKAKVPDAILFFRLGDFYEMFGQDAETAAPILEIALTGRDAGEKERIPMCGVPYHAVDNYLGKLVNSGYKVAICEQVEDPKSAKGIVKREIIRIVSPGTLTDNLLAEQANNFLASIYHRNEWGLAYLDISTGEFTIFQTSELNGLLTEISRIRPAELLLPPDLFKAKYWKGYYCTLRERRFYQDITPVTERFPQQTELLKEFSVASSAANALWTYLNETLPGTDPSHILEIKNYRQDEWMLLDSWTRRNLELTESMRGRSSKGTLLAVLDQTKTAFGGRLLKRWIEQPLLRKSEISKRLDIIDDLVNDGFLRGDLLKLLTGVYDLERLMGKVSYGNINAKDILSLAHTLNVLPSIHSSIEISQAHTLKSYLPHLVGLDSIASLLERALNPDAPLTLKEGHLIRDGYSNEIDELRRISTGGKEWLAQLENSERERTGIRSLKIGFNKVFGYYIEVTHANSHLVPSDYLRKQTLANAERFITPELKDFEQKILGAEEKLIEMEYQLFMQLREEVRAYTEAILQAAHALAEIDVFVSLAEVAVKNHYVRPQINEDGELIVLEGRHPVVEQMLEPGLFVPNDTHLSRSQHLAIITGPNMAGKSTYMRQVALIVLMAHLGSFVPAQMANIALVDRIFTRVGASDDLASGQSTFMVEMQEVAYILKNCTERSLIILDEIGRGTATFDGLSIAWSVAEYLVKNSSLMAKTLFATHYHELTQLAESLPGIFNLHVGVREHGEDIVFLHKILPGRADRSYGIQVARLAGLPPELIQRSKVLLTQLEASSPQNDLLKEPEDFTQLTIFETPEIHPMVKEIADLAIEDMTPRQALQYLFDLKDKLQVLDIL